MSLQAYLFQRNTRQLVYKSLDTNMKRSRATAQNIANVTTPGYKRLEVTFEDQLQDALKKKIDGNETDKNHKKIGRQAAIEKVQAHIFRANDPTLAGDINNVDIDIEMAKLAENKIQYHYNVRFAGFEKYQAAVSGRAY